MFDVFFDFVFWPGPVRAGPGDSWDQKNTFSEKTFQKNNPEPGRGNLKRPEKHLGKLICFFYFLYKSYMGPHFDHMGPGFDNLDQ